jgi:hypothetical protein
MATAAMLSNDADCAAEHESMRPKDTADCNSLTATFHQLSSPTLTLRLIARNSATTADEALL